MLETTGGPELDVQKKVRFTKTTTHVPRRRLKEDYAIPANYVREFLENANKLEKLDAPKTKKVRITQDQFNYSITQDQNSCWSKKAAICHLWNPVVLCQGGKKYLNRQAGRSCKPRQILARNSYCCYKMDYAHHG